MPGDRDTCRLARCAGWRSRRPVRHKTRYAAHLQVAHLRRVLSARMDASAPSLSRSCSLRSLMRCCSSSITCVRRVDGTNVVHPRGTGAAYSNDRETRCHRYRSLTKQRVDTRLGYEGLHCFAAFQGKGQLELQVLVLCLQLGRPFRIDPSLLRGPAAQ